MLIIAFGVFVYFIFINKNKRKVIYYFVSCFIKVIVERLLLLNG